MCLDMLGSVEIGLDDELILAFDVSIPQVRNDLLTRQLGDHVVAWSPIASEPLSLDPLSAALLQLLDGQTSAGDLVADLCEVLEVPQSVAREALRRQLWLFDVGRLLTTSPPSVDVNREHDVFPSAWDP